MSTPDFGIGDKVALSNGQVGKVIALTGNHLVWHRSTRMVAHVHLDGGPVVAFDTRKVVSVIESAFG